MVLARGDDGWRELLGAFAPYRALAVTARAAVLLGAEVLHGSGT